MGWTIGKRRPVSGVPEAGWWGRKGPRRGKNVTIPFPPTPTPATAPSPPFPPRPPPPAKAAARCR